MSDHSLHPTLSAGAMSPDTDPEETAEWTEALRSLIASSGPQRARFVLDRLAVIAREPAIGWHPVRGTPYVNTIPVDRQPAFPGDRDIERRIKSILRWNAMAMVVRANKQSPGIGGHISPSRSGSDH